MNPNDARIKRIYTRRVGSQILDQSLKIVDPFEVVVEWEAGSVKTADGGPWEITIVALDITAGSAAPAAFNQNIAGNWAAGDGHSLGGGDWHADPSTDAVLTITPPAGSEGHIYRYTAMLVAQVDIVSFVESPLFCITA